MGNEKQMRVNRKELEMGFEISSKIWECQNEMKIKISFMFWDLNKVVLYNGLKVSCVLKWEIEWYKDEMH